MFSPPPSAPRRLGPAVTIVVRFAVRLAVTFGAALAILGALAAPARAGFDPDAIYDVPSGGAPHAGEPEGLVTIVEFSDYACGYCIRARATMASLELLYPGQLRWVHRSVPFISGTPLGAEAAHAAAAQGQLEAMEAQLYALGGRYDRVAVEMIAQGLGLDMNRFRAALDSGAGRAAVAADVALAQRLGVTVTPTFFINGRAVLGSVPLSTFAAVIEAELVRAQNAQRQAAVAGGAALTGEALYRKLIAGGLPGADEGPRVRTPTIELSPLLTYRVGLGLPGLQRGPATAPATLVVFSDFECQFCARNEPAIEHVRKTFGPLVRVVFRHLPLPFHKSAQLAAEASMAAAAQGKFWDLHDRLFKAASLTRADLEREAEAVGLDLPRFRADLDNHTYRDRVRLDAAGGMAMGVDGTPVMFLNGVMISGAKSPAQLEELVRRGLAQAQLVLDVGVAAEDVYAVAMVSAVGHERSDPTTVPLPRAAQLMIPPVGERLQAVVAGCRRGDRVESKLQALPEPQLSTARQLCAPYNLAP